MTVYHVSPDGPRPCKDTSDRCPYAKAGKPHFGSQEEAQGHYESVMEEQFGSVSKLSKIESARQKTYATTDKAKSYAAHKVDDAKGKINEGRAVVAHEAHLVKEDFASMRNDAVNLKNSIARKSSEKLSQFKTKASDASHRAAETTKSLATRAKDVTSEKATRAAEAVRKHGTAIGRKAAATGRVVKRIAALVGRDVATGTRRVDNRFQITSRIKSAVKKVSEPTSRYAKSRASMIKRIANEEFKPKRSSVDRYSESPAQQTESQKVLSSYRKDDFFRGA